MKHNNNEKIHPAWAELAEIRKPYSHPTERNRPTETHGTFMYTPEEIAYNAALMLGKKVFLSRVGEEFRKLNPTIKTGITEYGDEWGTLGYMLQIPGLEIAGLIPLRESIGLASIGHHDHDLEIKAKHPTIVDIIKQLAPAFEYEVAKIETKPSMLKPHKVYLSKIGSGYLADTATIDKYLQTQNETGIKGWMSHRYTMNTV
jgi:hypothetical protein